MSEHITVDVGNMKHVVILLPLSYAYSSIQHVCSSLSPKPVQFMRCEASSC